MSDHPPDAVPDPFADIDVNDPQAVARALAEIGMRAGARQAVLEHMHARIGRALKAINDATAALVTRDDMEARMAAMESDIAVQRASDKRALAAIMLAFAGIVLAAFVAIGIAVAGNTQARQRQQEFLDTVLVRQEFVAICTRTEPTEQAIRACINEHVASEGLPSGP